MGIGDADVRVSTGKKKCYTHSKKRLLTFAHPSLVDEIREALRELNGKMLRLVWIPGVDRI
jgi:anthranilate phosphoribosyltransferase